MKAKIMDILERTVIWDRSADRIIDLIIKEIDDMIAEHQKEISPYVMDDVTDALNELKNKFKEMK